ncbi:hypothetical protein Ciccas_006588, partial [Cichlidogyrus casuarinus]
LTAGDFVAGKKSKQESKRDFSQTIDYLPILIAFMVIISCAVVLVCVCLFCRCGPASRLPMHFAGVNGSVRGQGYNSPNGNGGSMLLKKRSNGAANNSSLFPLMKGNPAMPNGSMSPNFGVPKSVPDTPMLSQNGGHFAFPSQRLYRDQTPVESQNSLGISSVPGSGLMGHPDGSDQTAYHLYQAPISVQGSSVHHSPPSTSCPLPPPMGPAPPPPASRTDFNSTSFSGSSSCATSSNNSAGHTIPPACLFNGATMLAHRYSNSTSGHQLLDQVCEANTNFDWRSNEQSHKIQEYSIASIKQVPVPLHIYK